MFSKLHNVRWTAYPEGVQPSHQALRQQRHPVPAALAVVRRELPPLEIQIFHPHPYTPGIKQNPLFTRLGSHGNEPRESLLKLKRARQPEPSPGCGAAAA